MSNSDMFRSARCGERAVTGPAACRRRGGAMTYAANTPTLTLQPFPFSTIPLVDESTLSKFVLPATHHQVRCIPCHHVLDVSGFGG